MRQVYCDNSSTSFPKAPGLGKAVGMHLDHCGYNISRGNYSNAYSVEEAVIETKDLLCDLFHFDMNRNVIFTPGATASLNMIVKGILKKGDHVITSSMEHNAVVRPIRQLLQEGVEWDEAACNEKGELESSAVAQLIKPNTKLVLIMFQQKAYLCIVRFNEIQRYNRASVVCCIFPNEPDAIEILDSINKSLRQLCFLFPDRSKTFPTDKFK